MRLWIALIGLIFFLNGCDGHPWNDPYPNEDPKANTYYTSFAEQPKTLDPARSYSSDEATFIGQIYEPPLQYDYLKRPYELIPLTATEVPQAKMIDGNSVYEITIRPNIFYQPHPAFKQKRELTAEDYVYQIKRLADPALKSPIFSLMSQVIVGMEDFYHELQPLRKKMKEDEWLDLRAFRLKGVEVIDRYRYRITVKGQYPQFIYWLAMPFFSAMAWEVDRYYHQPGMRDQNLSLDWSPVGTGPYQLTENNPNRRMVLVRNPNFHEEFFNGQRLPFVDRFIFTLEKESIPRWTKFLQGYYDASSVSNDSFDQAINIDATGQPQLTDEMKEKKIHMQSSVGTSVYYFGFNMLDPIVGGYGQAQRKLRQAISIAIDMEEFIAIFLNGRGIIAHSPIPPGIFGFREGQTGMNAYIYDWQKKIARRKSIAEAKKLLAEAGYPNGIDPKTKQPLILNYDVPASNSPDEKERLDWMRKQFAKLNIQLNIRNTLYNRFQEKMRNGQAQIFFWGWLADYPDPENFLFLLYGPNSKVKFGGENAANYQRASFDQLFMQMKNLPNGVERQKLIDDMIEMVRFDAPWVFAFYPENLTLSQSWVYPTKPSEVGNNFSKYIKIDPLLRAEKRKAWNQPYIKALIVIGLIFIFIMIVMLLYYWRMEHRRLK